MDEPKKLKSPILEIWRRLQEGNRRRKENAKKKKEEKDEKNANAG